VAWLTPTLHVPSGWRAAFSALTPYCGWPYLLALNLTKGSDAATISSPIVLTYGRTERRFAARRLPRTPEAHSSRVDARTARAAVAQKPCRCSISTSSHQLFQPARRTTPVGERGKPNDAGGQGFVTRIRRPTALWRPTGMGPQATAGLAQFQGRVYGSFEDSSIVLRPVNGGDDGLRGCHAQPPVTLLPTWPSTTYNRCPNCYVGQNRFPPATVPWPS